MRYRVLDLPVIGTGAFTPTMATNPVASSFGLVQVSGSPGTEPIPVPAPTRVWAPPISFDPKTQPSNCSPDVFFPDLYRPSAANMGPSADAGVGMFRRRLNEMPVPAVNIVRSGVPNWHQQPVGGRKVTAWPRAFQRWGTRG